VNCNQQLCFELLSVIKSHRETEPTQIRYNIFVSSAVAAKTYTKGTLQKIKEAIFVVFVESSSDYSCTLHDSCQCSSTCSVVHTPHNLSGTADPFPKLCYILIKYNIWNFRFSRWRVWRWQPSGIYRRFRGAYCLITLMIEAVSTIVCTITALMMEAIRTFVCLLQRDYAALYPRRLSPSSSNVI
jgi:hypothetical protein